MFRSHFLRPRIAAALALLAAALAGAAAAGDAPPAADFGLTPRVEAVSMSPDGMKLAWIERSGTYPTVAIFDTGKGTMRRVGDPDTSVKLRGLEWADDKTLIIEISATTKAHFNRRFEWERFLYMAVDADGGGPRNLLMNDRLRQFVSGASLHSLQGSRPRTVIMSSWDFNATAQRSAAGTRIAQRRQDSGWVSTLFEVDLDTGKGRALESGTQYTQAWVVDARGEAVARSEWDPSHDIFRVLANDGLAWREILKLTDGEAPGLAGLTSDGKGIVLVGALGGDRSKAWAIPLDGSAPRVLREDPVAEVELTYLDPLTLAPAGVRFGGAVQRREWFDPLLSQRTQSLERTFKGMRVAIPSRSADGSRIVAAVDSPARPVTWYLVDFGKHTADIVGESHPQLAQAALGEVRVFDYAARDGTPLVAYLTMPPGTDAKGLPLVVLPHGGPEARDNYAFDWLAQFLATRGYAVVQPQFRGSTGFGEKHRRAGYRQWGGLMQDDVSDAVKALVAQGVASAGHVCIVGASYGGYAALAGAAFTPDLYACAASVAGVSDLPLMVGRERADSGEDSDTSEYWTDHIGSQFDESVINASPVNAAANVKAPVLLLHGKDDTVVPIQQSRLMADALHKAGKNVTLVELDGEDHWLSQSETRMRMLQELEGFLKQYL